MMWHGILCPICGKYPCNGHPLAPTVYDYQKQQEYKKLFESITNTLKPSEIAVGKIQAQEFLEHKGWKRQLTSDNKEYWSKNSGNLMTLTDAFLWELESQLPRKRGKGE